MAGFVFHQLLGVGVVCFLDQIPNPAFRIAEPGECAKVLLVGEQHRGAFNGLSLLQIRLMAGCFRAVEMDLAVRAVTEGFVGGLTAAAKRILRLCGVCLSFPVFERFPAGVGHNPLLAEWQAPADEVGTICGDLNLRSGLFALFHMFIIST